MKDFVIIFFIILIVFGGDFIIKNHLDKTTNELVKDLQHLREKTILAKQTDNIDNIKEEFKNIENTWKKTSDIWSIIIMHQEIDNIEQSLTRMRANINNKMLEDALGEIETAIFFANHINEREKLKLKNIF